MSAFSVRTGLHVEEVDATLLVLDPVSSKVFELIGDQAEAFRLAESGTDDVPDRLTTAMAGLVELGLATAAGWDRRRVLFAGGVAAAAAVVVVALPSAAAAQSAPGGGGGDPIPTTTTTAPAGPTVPAAPTITEVINFGILGVGVAVTWEFGDDGGSPITNFLIYVNDDVQASVPAPGTATRVDAYQGDAIYVSAVNAVGESVLSAAVIVPPPLF